MISVIIPAHNEQDCIAETLDSVSGQTVQPGQVTVIADNCTDGTADIALANGAGVFRTTGNTEKKAGALNEWLSLNLPEMDARDYVLVMDADSVLDQRFIENAIRRVDARHPAVGGVFTGKPGGSMAGDCQRSEFERYKRDVGRKHGKTLVLTGTATLFTVALIREITGLPGRGMFYDTSTMTEDNELSMAVLHLGYKLIAPADCNLKTEVMDSWGDLWRQRYRWKRGAIETNIIYGLTRYTLKYWALQVWGVMGITATTLYLATLILAAASDRLSVHIVWLAVTVIYMTERAVTVRARGTGAQARAFILVYEMPYDLFLQACHAWAIVATLLRIKKGW